jgi:hypothetical protein
MGPTPGLDNIAALIASIGLLVAVLVLVERMLGMAFGAADAFRGRDRCHFCGAPLASRDGLGYESRCTRCERSQPWA